MELQKRKKMRSEYIDYSSAGAYFITICTNKRKKLFWDMQKFNPQSVFENHHKPVGAIINRPYCDCPLSHYGEIAKIYINDISNHYENVIVDEYIIMADHIHMILIILPDENGRLIIAPTISGIVRQLKTAITKQIGFPIWQHSFFDHVIRNKDDYNKTRKYIYDNPYKWACEIMFPEEKTT